MPACAVCGNEAPDDARFCAGCGSPLAAEASAPAKARKTVTVVFADITGSTELGGRLDPEAVQRVMERYFAAMRRVLDRHGGTVEKFIGDAVMAVFGIPVVHEDDALRAARAALEMADALATLNDELERRWGVTLQVRIGVNTGEVVAGDPSGGQAFATGDAVNVAARLQQAAQPGEILVGETTRLLLGESAAVAAVDPLFLKGKSGRVGAFRLLGVEPDASSLAPAARLPLVGRQAELRLLHETFERCVEERACRLVTVLGPPGIGKSRLVREALDEIGTRARVVIGRCPPYGEGITYLPLLDIVRQLAPRGRRDLASLVDDENGDVVAERVAGAVGFSATTAPSEETSWAVRRMFEALARLRPLAVVLDDVHWAEPTFLDLVEHVVGFARGVPLLVVCVARPELLDARPRWPSAGENVSLVRLRPLSEDESRELLERRLPDPELSPETRERVLDAAEGNPLFLEQMVAMEAEDGGDITVPPSIHALLAARIDRLPPPERALMQRAAVQGRVFSRRALAELVASDDAAGLEGALASLERRELVRRDAPALGGADGFRFAHGLICDVAYGFLSKETRSELHERLARWLEGVGEQPLGEREEVVGYHLEQAFRYRADLGPIGEREHALAADAAERLEASGRRALERSDLPAAIKLLERAAALLSYDDCGRAELLPTLAAALTEAGRLSQAGRAVEDALRCSRSVGDERLEARALVEQFSLRVQVDTEAAVRQIRRRGERCRRIFEAHGDDLGLCKLWRLRGLLHWLEGHCAAADAAWGQAGAHAVQAGDRRTGADIACWLASSALMGPVPVPFAIRRCEAIREEIRDDRYARAWTLRPLAVLRAMTGEFAVARRLVAESNAALEDLGLTVASAGSHEESYVAMLAGDAAEAESCLRRGYEKLEAMGEKAVLSTTAAELAEAVYVQGRYGEAQHFTEVSEAAAAADDVAAQIGWRKVRAKVSAKNGQVEEAERLARNAVALSARTDWLSEYAATLVDLGEVLREAGRTEDAESAIRQGVVLYEQKGNVVGAEKARALLVDLAPAMNVLVEGGGGGVHEVHHAVPGVSRRRRPRVRPD